MSVSRAQHPLPWILFALAGCTVAPPEDKPDTLATPDTATTDVVTTDSGPDSDSTGTDTDTTPPPPVDADGDGYAEEVDCDDTDPLVNPGAFERCNGIDDDCDGLVEAECTADMADYILTSKEGWNPPSYLEFVGDLDGDGRDDFVVGDDWSNWNGIGTFSIVLARDLVQPRMTLETATRVTLYVESDTLNNMYALSPVGDVDGDGLADVALYGSREATQGVAIFTGPSLAAGSGVLDVADSDYWMDGGTFERGMDVDSVGDVTGDGVEDLVVDDWDTTGIGRAAFDWVSGAAAATNASLADATFGSLTVQGEGWSFVGGGGDVDGDGVGDVVSASAFGTCGDSTPDCVRLFLGAGLAGDHEGDDADAWWKQGIDDQGATFACRVVSDVSMDGSDDLLCSHRATYLITDPLAGVGQEVPEVSALSIQPVLDGARVGGTTTDVDGDGCGDLLVSVATEETSDLGVSLCSTGRTGTYYSDDLDFEILARGKAYPVLTPMFSRPGDITGDGAEEILAGSSVTDQQVYLFTGGGWASTDL